MNIAIIIGYSSSSLRGNRISVEGNINLTLVKAIVTLESFTWIYKGRIETKGGGVRGRRGDRASTERKHKVAMNTK